MTHSPVARGVEAVHGECGGCAGDTGINHGERTWQMRDILSALET